MATISHAAEGTEFYDLNCLLEKASVMQTKKGSNFLKFSVRDQTGSIDGVLWNYSGKLQEGSVVSLDGRVSSYEGKLQLTASRIDLSGDGSSPDKFARWTTFNVDSMWSDLVNKVESFTEPLTKFVAEELLLKHAVVAEAFRKAPAAKTVHNNWYGGLLEHVWSLCQIAEPVVSHYQKNYLAKISKDKVLFGLMLHDAGKVVEYDYNNPAFSFTGVGTMTPHIVLGPAWVYEQANKWWLGLHREPNPPLTPERFRIERAHLMHVLAAHHGQIEWGSPVKPCSIEAILVHHLDNLDSKVLHAWDYVAHKDGPISGFSQMSAIERVPYYNYTV